MTWTPGAIPPDPCPYCQGTVTLHQSSDHIYRRDYGPVWQCEDCKAYVGCHKGTTEPLGRLADAELRTAKKAAHTAFDPLWEQKIKRHSVSKKTARNAGYEWLAGQLEIDKNDCHIGMFDPAMCKRVAEVCAPYRRARVT